MMKIGVFSQFTGKATYRDVPSRATINVITASVRVARYNLVEG